MKIPFYIFGAGGHGKCVIEAARAAGLNPCAVIDDNPSVGSLLGIPVFKASEFPIEAAFQFIVAIGNCSVRREKFEHLRSIGGEAVAVIHPRAYVSPSAKIGAGTVVLALALVEACAIVGENTILNVHCIVGHDCHIGNHTHISGNVSLGGGCVIGDGAWISLGASIKERVTVGEDSFVGLGGMVSHDIHAHQKAISPNRREFVLMAK